MTRNGPPAKCLVWTHDVGGAMRQCGQPVGHAGDHAPLLDAPRRDDVKALGALQEALRLTPADELLRALGTLMRQRSYQLTDGTHPEGADAYDDVADSLLQGARRIHPYT